METGHAVPLHPTDTRQDHPSFEEQIPPLANQEDTEEDKREETEEGRS